MLLMMVLMQKITFLSDATSGTSESSESSVEAESETCAKFMTIMTITAVMMEPLIDDCAVKLLLFKC